jgi:hypothetical protein
MLRKSRAFFLSRAIFFGGHCIGIFIYLSKCISLYIYIYVCISSMYICENRKNGKRQTSICLLQMETENGRLFSLFGKQSKFMVVFSVDLPIYSIFIGSVFVIQFSKLLYNFQRKSLARNFRVSVSWLYCQIVCAVHYFLQMHS